MAWTLNLPHAATVTIGRGIVSVRHADGSLVNYRPPAFGALVLRPLTEKGRLLELRRQ